MSCSKVFERVVELKDDVNVFLLQKDKYPRFAGIFCDDEWLSAVGYLVDILKKNALIICPFKAKMMF